MHFVWDEEKNRRNLAKHGVSFETAKLVFDDPHQLTVPDPCEAEQRWITMGVLKGMIVLLVVHTVKEADEDEEIRIISARKATRHERKSYDAAH